MGQLREHLDLDELGVEAGESRSLDIDVHIDSFLSGGLKYDAVPNKAPTLAVSRTVNGWAIKLSYVADVSGSCSRCLKDASVQVKIVAREIDQHSDGEEMTSPYFEEDNLDLKGWVQDALILVMPSKVLCRKDCRGLCSVCGADLNTNDPADHRHNEGDDPRWAKLKQVKFD